MGRECVRGVCNPIITEQCWGRGTFPASCFGAGVQAVVDGSLSGLKDGLPGGDGELLYYR